ncbi:MAG TPA: helix-turn-helix domain-containing protein [Dehalococcoidia bacterium]|nr:helix-turn-helix domain-containing protein [Dehalococcoidia bacterium]
MIPLTLQELARISGVSQSYLGRIENGERFPSAPILRRIAQPLGFSENELFVLAGYLPPQSETIAESGAGFNHTAIHPHVARELAKESIETQYAVLTILSILKSLSKYKYT